MGLFSTIRWLSYSRTRATDRVHWNSISKMFFFFLIIMWNCENQVELLETTFQFLEIGNYFYCADLLGAGKYVYIFWVLSNYFWKWMRMKVLLWEDGEWTMNVRQDIVGRQPSKSRWKQKCTSGVFYAILAFTCFCLTNRWVILFFTNNWSSFLSIWWWYKWTHAEYIFLTQPFH